MSYKEHLDQLMAKVQANPEPIGSLHYVYQFNLKEEEPFQVRFENGTVEVLDGTPYEAECTLSLSTPNFIKLLNDDLNTTMAFMTGSLKVDGKVGLALKLHETLKQYA